MKIVARSVDIDAPADAVWTVVTDLGAYAGWNPFMERASGSVRVGERLEITMRPGTRSMTFRPIIQEITVGRSIRWLGRLPVPGLFDGAHWLTIEQLDAGRSRFSQREEFSGLLVPLVGSLIRDTDAGFAAMNEALKRRVESGPSS